MHKDTHPASSVLFRPQTRNMDEKMKFSQCRAGMNLGARYYQFLNHKNNNYGKDAKDQPQPVV